MPTFVVGDVHGQRDALTRLLRDAGLIDGSERWVGGDAVLWLLGDLVDRGPDGLAAIDLVRRLQGEAAVGCLLGNHEVMLMSAFRFGDQPTTWSSETFGEIWRRNGGEQSDLDGLTPEHRAWIASLPPLALVDGWLLLHADTDRYAALGDSIAAVGATTERALTDGTPDDLESLLDVLSDRMKLRGTATVDRVLSTFGGSRIVHGHTPIAFARDIPAALVTGPLVSDDGRVWNVDHCLFGGGPGFVTRLDSVSLDAA